MKKWAALSVILAILPNVSLAEDANGRYAFFQSRIAVAEQYVLDTKTGRIWNFVKNESGETVLEPRYFVGEHGLSATPNGPHRPSWIEPKKDIPSPPESYPLQVPQ